MNSLLISVAQYSSGSPRTLVIDISYSCWRQQINHYYFWLRFASKQCSGFWVYYFTPSTSLYRSNTCNMLSILHFRYCWCRMVKINLAYYKLKEVQANLLRCLLVSLLMLCVYSKHVTWLEVGCSDEGFTENVGITTVSSVSMQYVCYFKMLRIVCMYISAIIWIHLISFTKSQNTQGVQTLARATEND